MKPRKSEPALPLPPIQIKVKLSGSCRRFSSEEIQTMLGRWESQLDDYGLVCDIVRKAMSTKAEGDR